MDAVLVCCGLRSRGFERSAGRRCHAAAVACGNYCKVCKLAFNTVFGMFKAMNEQVSPTNNSAPAPATEPQAVSCRPTWYICWRLLVLFAMLAGFSAYFYYDAGVGYPLKNEQYFAHRRISRLGEVFESKYAKDAVGWQQYVSGATWEYPSDHSLPAGLPVGAALPADLFAFDNMAKGWHGVWERYSLQRGWDLKPPQEPLGSYKIKEQYVACVVSGVLALLPLWILLRSLRRRMAISVEGNVQAAGQSFAVEDIKRLDLRDWQKKGLAFAWIGRGTDKLRKVRLDGLAYGGFEAAKQQPAEQFMQSLLGLYKGEIITYAEE